MQTIIFILLILHPEACLSLNVTVLAWNTFAWKLIMGCQSHWYHQYINTLKYRIPHFYCILVIWLIISFYTTMTCFFYRRYKLLSPKKWCHKSFCDFYDLKNLIVSSISHNGSNPILLDVIIVSKPCRFAKTFNCECILSEFHDFVGAATKKHMPLSEPRRSIYRSYKNFDDDAFRSL